ncbi:hypothetical protein NIES4101_65540 [Calothrix sp. NIES-4101]|nr:hypothetical protein NIES4101_65540 [Calothrix sp. NIES-4101]
MQLSYRGSHYESDISELTSTKYEKNAKYRGISYRISKPRLLTTFSRFELKYRGVTYIRGCH